MVHFIYLFIFIYLFLAASGLSCGMWDLLLQRTGSVVAVLGPSCPTVYGILVPQPGLEPVSPALEGGFSTTGPPGKSLNGTL